MFGRKGIGHKEIARPPKVKKCLVGLKNTFLTSGRRRVAKRILLSHHPGHQKTSKSGAPRVVFTKDSFVFSSKYLGILRSAGGFLLRHHLYFVQNSSEFLRSAANLNFSFVSP